MLHHASADSLLIITVSLLYRFYTAFGRLLDGFWTAAQFIINVILRISIANINNCQNVIK